MKNEPIKINEDVFEGIEIPLPKAPIVLAKGPRGFVMCGYLNLEAAESLNVAAAMVKGVSSVSDLLAAPVQGMTSAAAERGIRKGMSGRDALLKMK